MKALVFNSGKVRLLTDVPFPEPAHGEVLVQVMACGINGSGLYDIDKSQEIRVHTDGITPGQEFSGVVTKVHDQNDSNLLGKRVAVIAYKACGVCEFCRTNRENLCKNSKRFGQGKGWGEVNRYPGGMAEYCQVWAAHAYPVADHITFEEASLINSVSLALTAVKKGKSVYSEDCLVMGSSPVGLLIVRILKQMGARKVIFTDAADSWFEKAKSMGADHVINSSTQDVAEETMVLTGNLGVKHVFDTSGTADSQNTGLKVLCARGMLINLVSNSTEVEYELMSLGSERSISSVTRGSYANFRESLRMIEAGLIDVKPLITHVLGIEDYQRGVEALSEAEKHKAMQIILKPNI